MSDKNFAPTELLEVVGFRILQIVHSYGVIRKENPPTDGDMFVEKSKNKIRTTSGVLCLEMYSS